MRENFERALAFVLREEGEIADDPHDPGGLTKYGITQATLALARGADVRRSDLMSLTRREAGSIYRTLYWDKIAGNHLPTGIDLMLFDFAVNSGPARAVKTLQTILELKADGVAGPETIARVAQAETTRLVNAIHDARLTFLRSLSVWRFFGNGWSRRNDRVRQTALRWSAQNFAIIAKERNLPMATKTIEPLPTTKSILESRTVWANLIGLASLGLSIFGYGALDVGGLTDAVLQMVAAGSFVASTLFRITAKAKLT